MQSVRGVVTEGWRIASGLSNENPFGGSPVRMQIPLFLERGLDLSMCYPGTLNVSIAPKIRTVLVTEPNYPAIKWHPERWAEDFFMFECEVWFRGTCYKGWVYYPDPSKKKRVHPRDTFEILAPPISGIAYGDSVVLVVNANEIRIE